METCLERRARPVNPPVSIRCDYLLVTTTARATSILPTATPRFTNGATRERTRRTEKTFTSRSCPAGIPPRLRTTRRRIDGVAGYSAEENKAIHLFKRDSRPP